MGTPAADTKATSLSDELKEFALTLPTTVFPKNFFCAICSQLAFDSWKLLCCNKSICSECHAKLEFPTSCPLCEHSPLEADTCTVNKNLRSTMRAWLQKQKKKEDAKNTSLPPTPVVAAPATGLDTQPTEESADHPVQSVEAVPNAEVATDRQPSPAHGEDSEAAQPTELAAPQSKENTTVPDDTEAQVGTSVAPGSENPDESVTAQDGTDNAQNGGNSSADGMYGNNSMMNMNGMPGQFGFGFNPNQGNFNGMGFNGMNPMNGMSNMMGGGYMNPMDFNNMNMSNGMYGGFGGNMSMPGMNDMSAMNMMNYGGGFGNNGWQGGMNGGYGNFNDFNPMGGYNQSGAQYPQMMNQFPKNNFQNQNRFPSNGPAFSQKNNRQGSFGNFGNPSGPGFQQNAHSRPGSRSGPSQNRDGQSPAGDADAVPETKVDGEHADASAEPATEGKVEGEDASEPKPSPAVKPEGETTDASELTRAADDETNDTTQITGLNHIQTVDSGEADQSNYGQNNSNGIQSNQGYQQGMSNNFSNAGPHMNGPYGSGMGYNQYQNFNHSGGFNGAYGAATVLTGEPRGVGVAGAPTGPRAMREGRPNTGFSSRAINIRHNAHTPVTAPIAPPAQDAAPASPQRKGRGYAPISISFEPSNNKIYRSPERDDTLRTKDKSPSRSRSRSRSPARSKKEEEKDDYRERSRSPDRESKQRRRDRSPTPTSQDDHDRRKDRRHHRSSRYDDYDDREDERYDDHDDRYRDERDDRGDRTRSASVDSKYRSRRDKDKHRSSRSHRDRSREHRRRHRSRTPEDKYEEEDTYDNGIDLPSESSSRRKHRIDKDKYRERERDRSRERDRDRDRRDRRDRDYDRDYELDEKDRSREKDRDRKRSRRDRDEENEQDYEDDKHRSSRRSRKDRDRDRDRDRERDRDRDRDYDTKEREKEPEPAPVRAVSPPLNAPTGPSADGFSIRGFSKTKRAESSASISTTKPMAPPPTGPRNFQPPKGPAADRDRERRDSRDHKRTPSVSSITPTPTTPTGPSNDHNHYAADREKHIKERVEQNNRDKLISSIHGRATGRSSNSNSNSNPTAPSGSSTNKLSLSSKRSRDDIERDDHVPPPSTSIRGEKEISNIPTGPAAHRDKRRKSGENNAIANMFTQGLRKQAKGRRGGVKNEGDVERELERVERERDRRW